MKEYDDRDSTPVLVANEMCTANMESGQRNRVLCACSEQLFSIVMQLHRKSICRCIALQCPSSGS